MSNIIDIDKINCTGCAMCMNICPYKCISMKPNAEGFLYPVIDQKKCVQCGICVKNCPIINECKKSAPMEVYASQIVNEIKLRQSSSGGVAALFSEYVLSAGGIVYGCVYDKELKVCHKRISRISDLSRLCGSKYVQSDFSEVYYQLEKDCEIGKLIVVIGTPCQIAGVRNFLKKEYENLILIDLICHGVPSPELFKQYLSWKSEKMGGEILSYNFRDKSAKGWGTVYRAVTATTTATSIATLDPYYFSFIFAETYRESCYQCKYARCERCGDITIGDYWGFDEQHPKTKMVDKNGISAVLVNTKKGQRYFCELKDQQYLIPSTLDKIMVRNSNLHHPAIRTSVRDIFYQNVAEHGFQWAYKKLLREKRYYIDLTKNIIPQTVKDKIKKLIGRK